MIHVQREPDNLGPPHERCAFCANATPYWYEPKDIPVCQKCAIDVTHDEVPSKEEWAKRGNLKLVR